MPTQTAEVARGVDPNGRAYQRRAFQALPLLVRQARAGQTIYYSDLAAEMGMPNERNLNYVLGAVGTSLAELGEQWGEQVPPLQAVVVNRANGIPGTGFVQSLVDPQLLAGANKRTRKQVIDGMLATVFTYPKWDNVLTRLGSTPIQGNASVVRKASAFHAAGEGSEHKALKAYVAAHPAAVGVKGAVRSTVVEYRLPSGDEIDVYFETRGGVTAVEVKPASAPEADMARGIFQCVKYEAVLNAVAASQGLQTDVHVLLALGGALTPATRALANTIGVTVLEQVPAHEPTP